MRRASAALVASLALGGCETLNDAGDIASGFAMTAGGLVAGIAAVATAPVWIPALYIASRGCGEWFAPVGLPPTPEAEASGFAVTALPPAAAPARLGTMTRRAAYAIAGAHYSAVAVTPDGGTLLLSGQTILTAMQLPAAPGGDAQWQHVLYGPDPAERCPDRHHPPPRHLVPLADGRLVSGAPSLIYPPLPAHWASDASFMRLPSPTPFPASPNLPGHVVGMTAAGRWVAIAQADDPAAGRDRRMPSILVEGAVPPRASADLRGGPAWAGLGGIPSALLPDDTLLLAEPDYPAGSWRLVRVRGDLAAPDRREQSMTVADSAGTALASLRLLALAAHRSGDRTARVYLLVRAEEPPQTRLLVYDL